MNIPQQAYRHYSISLDKLVGKIVNYSPQAKPQLIGYITIQIFKPLKSIHKKN